MTGFTFACIAIFIHVFLRSFQQRNVSTLRYWPVLPISVCMTLGDFYLILYVVQNGYNILQVASLGAVGGVASMLSMWVHSNTISRGDSNG